jgi:LPXTG-motif cell wall-anchored protein
MVITYTTVVNKNADFSPTGNINEVYFDYSNDPNHDYDGDEPKPDEPMGETVHDKTKTLLTNIEILKTGDNGTVRALEGAEFEIESEDYNVTLVTGEKFELDATGTYYKLTDGTYTTTEPTESTKSYYESTTNKYKKVTFTNAVTTPGEGKKVTVITGEDGKISLKGLKAGRYTIKETKAPEGYNVDPTTYIVELGLSDNGFATAKIVKTYDNPKDSFAFDDNTATAKVTVDNKSGATLPGTGGIGTVIFYVLGSILVVGSGIVLISRKRMENK